MYGESRDKQINKQLEDLEKLKDDSTKYHSVIKDLYSKGPKKPIQVFNDEKEFAGSESEQIKYITKHFKNFLTKSSNSDSNSDNNSDSNFNSDSDNNGSSESSSNNFSSSNSDIPPPCEMSTPFTKEEIKKAV